MKVNLHLFLLFCTLLALFACGHKPYPHSLTAVDSLASVNPDSAIALINSLNNEMKSAPQSTQMYYQLLCIKANDKAYIPHTSDSLILPVLHYYIEKNDEQHLPEAYYYAGRVYRDLEDAPQALNYFEKALGALPENGGYKQKSKIYSQMGTLFSYQNVHDEALKMYKKSQKCDITLKDSASMVFNFRDIAYEYRHCNKTDSALYYYQKAFDSANALQNAELAAMVQSQIAGLYIILGEYDLAKKALQHSLKNMDVHNQSGIYSIASKLYHKTGYTDSAIYYYKELVECGTIYAKKLAHKGLAQIALEQNNPQKASAHFLLYEQCSDSIDKITDTETIRHMNSLYNYQLREKENNRLKTENEQKEKFTIIIGTVTNLLIILLIACILYYRWKKAQFKLQMEKLKQLKKEQYQNSLQTLDNNKLKIKELEEKLEKVGQTNAILKAQLEEQKEGMLYINKQVEIELERREESKSLLEKSDIYHHIQKQLSKNTHTNLLPNDWKTLEIVINSTYDDFKEKLYNLYHMKEHEYHVCLLIKTGCSFADIAKLTDHSKEAIISTCRRLYKKAFSKEGSAKDWNEIISLL